MVKHKTQQNCSKVKSSNLPMVSKSLTLTLNLLTGYTAGSSLPAFGSITSFFWSVSELSGFCVFLKDESTDLCENFFQALGEST